MTYQQFLAELKKTLNFWKLISTNGSIRYKGLFETTHCPITVVCFFTTGVLFAHEEWEQAAKALGLDPIIADRIVRASDWNTNTKIRRDLLEATRLTEINKN